MLDRIENAIEDIRNGKMIIVVDDEDRENEGDFIVAAQHTTPEVINFMSKEPRADLCSTYRRTLYSIAAGANGYFQYFAA
jgi:3,4-dihydroxy 2-butanone 4-phosphate synthase/GTP cyclohydrolase II